ncbi:hypothetical protein [Sphaerobacter sp.]|uniref:hypothetical protein n=1 Tax=Sphaerobacter sp. TaxID=2099654 RepID=UPI001DFDB83E|nr:hypothetical protein [Sphaerobacter sp.]MBX5444191.1 hypothetical protein [Sphaerobacter sp.]
MKPQADGVDGRVRPPWQPPDPLAGAQGDALARSDMRKRRRRIATILLLLLEAAGLIATVVVVGQGVDWKLEETREVPSALATDWVFLAGTGVPVAILAVLAALALALRFSSGWTLAMLAQGLLLFNCLVTYFGQRLDVIYPLMVVGILLVLYLNSYAVRTALQPQPPQPEPRDGA